MKFNPITGDIIIATKQRRLFFNKVESFVIIKVKEQLFSVERTDKGFLLGLFNSEYYLENYDVEIYRADYNLSRGVLGGNLFSNLGSFAYQPKRSFKEFISDIYDIEDLDPRNSKLFKLVHKT